MQLEGQEQVTFQGGVACKRLLARPSQKCEGQLCLYCFGFSVAIDCCKKKALEYVCPETGPVPLKNVVKLTHRGLNSHFVPAPGPSFAFGWGCSNVSCLRLQFNQQGKPPSQYVNRAPLPDSLFWQGFLSPGWNLKLPHL